MRNRHAMKRAETSRRQAAIMPKASEAVAAGSAFSLELRQPRRYQTRLVWPSDALQRVGVVDATRRFAKFSTPVWTFAPASGSSMNCDCRREGDAIANYERYVAKSLVAALRADGNFLVSVDVPRSTRTWTLGASKLANTGSHRQAAGLNCATVTATCVSSARGPTDAAQGSPNRAKCLSPLDARLIETTERCKHGT